MKWAARQDKSEEKVHEAIEELCEELDISIPYYPEVHWIGRRGDLNSLGLRNSHLEDSKRRKMAGWSEYLKKERAILLYRDCEHHVNEESVHFVHLINSNLRFVGRPLYDWTALEMIVEAIGFFGSKLLSPERPNPYQKFPDLLSLNSAERARFFMNYFGVRNITDLDLTEIIIHQQGYSVGERAFYAYHSGGFSKKEVKKLMLNRFESDGSAVLKFGELRKRFGIPLQN